MLTFDGKIMNKNIEKCDIIYGVDITEKIEPFMVRDAIIQCFYEAHNDVLEIERERFGNPPRIKFEEMKKDYVKKMVQDIFKKIDGDFIDPAKNDLFRVIENLREIALDYRTPDVIKKHFTEILLLIDKL